MDKRKSIAIITLNGYHNYGNRFQNYALQQVLKYYASDVETLIISHGPNEFATSLLQRLKGKSFKMLIKVILFKFINKIGLHSRSDKFNKALYFFSQKFIHEIHIPNFDENVLKYLSKYDYFVVGSDQVWNPYFVKDLETYFLTFSPTDKRIAYAASFGLTELPEEYKENYVKWLTGIDNISVREHIGADIVKNLTGKVVPVVLDPTMLLSKNEWMKLATPIELKNNNRILLVYFLGKLSKEVKKEILVFAKKNRLKIIRVNYPLNQYYLTSPTGLLTLFDKSTFIITDSFHGAVFSLLFEKPFIVYQRKGSVEMYSRIETLYTKFNLKNRHGMSLDDENIWNIDYNRVNSILDIERLKSKEYLDKCFKGSQTVKP